MITTTLKLWHLIAFNGVRDPSMQDVVLLACTVNGEPSAAICRMSEDRHGNDVSLQPLFVAVTASMKLRDANGMPTVNDGEPHGPQVI